MPPNPIPLDSSAGSIFTGPAAGYTVVTHRATVPAPSIAAVLADLNDATTSTLRDAYRHDPSESVFQSDNLERIAATALAEKRGVCRRGSHRVRPLDPSGLDPSSSNWTASAEARGERDRAIEIAGRCAAAPDPRTWRDGSALNRCRERLDRLRRRDP